MVDKVQILVQFDDRYSYAQALPLPLLSGDGALSVLVVVAAHGRLPPAEDWQAVANAAAEAALARGAVFSPTATFPRGFAG
ncbi:hypothetical protein CHLRE_02g085326v5 [Chlamydomonas reinhardtii]|uniref:Uncharacterized protein n=1 Tax=Chlamydomonas reinhardtii TaxID=3055 RepID=A0A2K3E0S5_CHLRE|nr:uncharacterized protein CHLRE_02g085326v5 [Chlamydomonas reinhardtii]PNW86410.1 hypothetical protein CHLRE_02g085326v5 [Chlamydomonas reinhardtii]